MKAVGARFFAVVLFAAGTVYGQQASDDARAKARDLGYAGVERFQGGDFAGAFAQLDEAYRVLRAPTLGLWSARALAKLNRWVEATERLQEVLRQDPKAGEAAVQLQALRDAQVELDALTARLPSLIIEIQGVPANETRVTLDGAPLASALLGDGFPVDPGTHVIVAQVGSQRQEQKVTLVEGKQARAVLRFSPTPEGAASTETEPSSASDQEAAQTDTAPPSSTRRIVGWVMVGTGGAGLVLGATTGLLALGKKSSLTDAGSCRGSNCLVASKSDVDSYNGLRLVSTVGFVAGAALGAAGVVVLLTAPRGSGSQQARGQLVLHAGAGEVSLRGSF